MKLLAISNGYEVYDDGDEYVFKRINDQQTKGMIHAKYVRIDKAEVNNLFFDYDEPIIEFKDGRIKRVSELLPNPSKNLKKNVL